MLGQDVALVHVGDEAGAFFVEADQYATFLFHQAGGQAGAEKALAILKNEMKRTMAYVGLQRTSDITGDIIWRGD